VQKQERGSLPCLGNVQRHPTGVYVTVGDAGDRRYLRQFHGSTLTG